MLLLRGEFRHPLSYGLYDLIERRHEPLVEGMTSKLLQPPSSPRNTDSGETHTEQSAESRDEMS